MHSHHCAHLRPPRRHQIIAVAQQQPEGRRHQFGISRLKQIHSLLMTAEISTLIADARKSSKCLKQHSSLCCSTAELGHRQKRRRSRSRSFGGFKSPSDSMQPALLRIQERDLLYAPHDSALASQLGKLQEGQIAAQ